MPGMTYAIMNSQPLFKAEWQFWVVIAIVGVVLVGFVTWHVRR